ncbi:MAG: DUF2723 domain-containing protein [Elusimicrobia bacterium]|nr:DUF2723 domain-containing protein [Candidatus Liberimonas magnetica]
MKQNLIYIILISILAFYTYTLYPACAPEDSGEYIAVCHTLGIAHSPGNPLYVLLGKISSLFPIGNSAYRLNLLSSLLAVLTLMVLFKILIAITKDIVVSIAAIVIFSFSYEFWYITTFAKTFTLITFLTALCLYSLILYLKEHTSLRYLYLSYYLVGFAIGGHYFLLMFIPLLFFVSIFSIRKDRIKFFAVSILLFFLGFSIHFYLPVRSSMSPLINTGNTSNIENLYNFLTRKEMSGFRMSNLAKASITKQEVLLKAKWFFFALSDHFSLIWAMIGTLGFFALWKNDKNIFYLILFLMIFSGPVWLVFSAFGLDDPFKEAMNERYLPVFESLFAIVIGSALGFVANALVLDKTKKLFFYILVFILSLSPLSAHIGPVNKRNNFLCDDYCLNFFRTIKPGSILFAGQHLDSIGRYMKFVRKKRSDLTFVIVPDKFMEILENSKNTETSIYADPSCRLYFSGLFKSYPVGLSYKCSPLKNIYDYNEYERPWLFYSYRNIKKSGAYKDFFSEMVLMWYMEAQVLFGDVSLSFKKKQQAIESYKRCISIGMYDQDILDLRTYNYRSITPRSSFMYGKLKEASAL